MELQLTRSTVRSWRWGDEASLVQSANNRHVWINLRDRFPHPYTEEDARQWMEWVLVERPETNFAIAVNDQVVGGVGFIIQADVHRKSAEVGFWLAESHWGRGIMTEAVGAVTAYAFEHFDLARLFATVFEWNPGSMRVLEKAGYLREACLRKSAFKDGRLIDQMLYAITRDG
jgi:RimJ/RimL family protein N-acetyltransferase